ADPGRRCRRPRRRVPRDRRPGRARPCDRHGLVGARRAGRLLRPHPGHARGHGGRRARRRGRHRGADPAPRLAHRRRARPLDRAARRTSARAASDGGAMTAPGTSAHARAGAAALRGARAQEIALPLVVVLLVIIGTLLKGTVFFSTANLWNVLVQATVAGTVAVGMTFVIATGGIDLGVGSVLGAAAIVGGHYFH